MLQLGIKAIKGQQFRILTDCKPLTYSISTLSVLLSTHLIRYVTSITSYILL